jgi:hypothetical protein
MKVIIDRFEGNFAVVELEDKSFCNMPNLLLPNNAKEGDVISISIDADDTSKRKKEASELFNDLIN